MLLKLIRQFTTPPSYDALLWSGVVNVFSLTNGLISEFLLLRWPLRLLLGGVTSSILSSSPGLLGELGTDLLPAAAQQLTQLKHMIISKKLRWLFIMNWLPDTASRHENNNTIVGINYKDSEIKVKQFCKCQREQSKAVFKCQGSIPVTKLVKTTGKQEKKNKLTRESTNLTHSHMPSHQTRMSSSSAITELLFY